MFDDLNVAADGGVGGRLGGMGANSNHGPSIYRTTFKAERDVALHGRRETCSLAACSSRQRSALHPLTKSGI
jgi:hypothetical protein